MPKTRKQTFSKRMKNQAELIKVKRLSVHEQNQNNISEMEHNNKNSKK